MDHLFKDSFKRIFIVLYFHQLMIEEHNIEWKNVIFKLINYKDLWKH
jgi:hypothetical protein